MISNPSLRALNDSKDWGQVSCLDSVDSTNLWARRQALEGAPHLSAYIALAQDAGRGRLGRSWHSPPRQSLYLSLNIHLKDLPLSEATKLTFAGALGIRDCLHTRGLEAAAIKWPNDVGVERGGAFFKLSGILAELLLQGVDSPRVILGLGLNLNQAVDDWPEPLKGVATSLLAETGRGADPLEIGSEVLTSLRPWLDAVLRGEGGMILRALNESCLTLGRRVGYSTPQGEILGEALGLGDEGDLIISGDDGQRHRVTAGDVRIL